MFIFHTPPIDEQLESTHVDILVLLRDSAVERGFWATYKEFIKNINEINHQENEEIDPEAFRHPFQLIL